MEVKPTDIRRAARALALAAKLLRAAGGTTAAERCEAAERKLMEAKPCQSRPKK